MIIYEIGELRNQDKIDTLIKRYTTRTKYVGLSYGSVTDDSIREKLNFPTRKGKEPEPLLRERYKTRRRHKRMVKWTGR